MFDLASIQSDFDACNLPCSCDDADNHCRNGDAVLLGRRLQHVFESPGDQRTDDDLSVVGHKGDRPQSMGLLCAG